MTVAAVDGGFAAQRASARAQSGRTGRVGRLRTRAAFDALRAEGRRGRHGCVRVTARLGGDRPAVAYAIGRAVGSAVVRNRVRRRLRAAAAELDLEPGDYLVAVTPQAAHRTYAELRDDLAAAVAEARRSGSRR